jgi:EpsI family protein
VKILTSCPSCLQGLSRYGDDLQRPAGGRLHRGRDGAQDPGRDWLPDYVAAPTPAASSGCWSDYGDDQRGGLQAHKPEVCYPAQGFNLRSNDAAELATSFGRVPVRRLDTQMGSRLEPVTYWFAFGDQVVSGRFEQRLTELRLGFEGKVPHGLLFRVSSIDGDAKAAYREQERFVNDLLSAMEPRDRMQVIGLAPRT